MKKIGLFFVTLMSVAAFAAEIEKPAEINLLDNPNFERGLARWVKSGGTFSLITSGSNVAKGSASASWLPSGANQTLRTGRFTPINALINKGCYGQIRYKTAESTNQYTLQIVDGSDNVLGTQTLGPQSDFMMASVAAPCGTGSTTVALRIVAASSAPSSAIYLDDAHLGSDTRLTEIGQAQFVGSIKYAQAGSCSWSSTSTTMANFTANTSCATPSTAGTASAPATKIPGITFASLPPGEYLVVAQGKMIPGTASTGSSAYQTYTLSDGSTNSGASYSQGGIGGSNNLSMANQITARFSYSTVQSNLTIQVQARTASASNSANVVADTGGENGPFEIYVYRYPSTSETGMRVDQLGWRVDANIGGANPSLGTASVSSYTGLENASLTLTNNAGSNVVSAQIPCSGTNGPTGTTCTAGNESVGVSFVAPMAGDVLACASFSNNLTLGASGAVSATFQIVETASNAQTILQEGKGRVDSYHTVANSAIEFPHRACGVFTFASAGQKTLRLMYEQAVTGTVSQSIVIGDQDATRGQRDIHWEVYPLNYLSGALPVFKGMVTSNTSGQERIERARIQWNTGVPTLMSQSGNWVGTITDTAVGDMIFQFVPGTFSAQPVCTIGVEPASMNTGAGTARVAKLGIDASSFRAFIQDDTGIMQDPHAVNVICMGPK